MIIYLLVSILLILIVSVLGAFFTGRTQRAYSVLKPEEIIYLSGKQITVGELAQEYRPTMHLRTMTPSPPVLWIWYEVVPNETTYDIVYYYNWENEINPNMTIHNYYSIFRSAYFGYPLYDIEYFQVNVNKSSGRIDKVKFESSTSDKYDKEIVEHIIVDVIRIDSIKFREIHRRSNGNIISDRVIIPSFHKNSVLVGTLTWNHMSCLITDHNKNEYVLNVDSDAMLKFLSSNNYSKYKFVRKSQGDHKTKEDKISSALALLAILLMVMLPAYLLTKLKGKKRQNV